MSDLPFDPVTEPDDMLRDIVSACQAEQSRRASLNGAPAQAVSACWQYKTAGGDPADILTAVQDWINSQAGAQ